MVALFGRLDHVVIGVALQALFLVVVGNVHVEIGGIEFLVDLLVDEIAYARIHGASPFWFMCYKM